MTSHAFLRFDTRSVMDPGRHNAKWDALRASNGFNVKDYGAKGDGVTDDYTAELAAKNAAAVNGGTVYYPTGTYITNTSLSFPANVRVVMDVGAIISIASTKTLTFIGPLDAGMGQHFAGAGTVDINPGSVLEINSQWWGAMGNGALSVDDTSALNKAFTALNSYGGVLRIPRAVSYYLISDDIGLQTGDNYVHIIGDGAKFHQATTSSTYNMFRIRSNMTIEDIELKGYVASGTGGSDVVPQSGYGFRGKEIGGGLDGVLFLNCKVWNCSFDGWYIDDKTGGGHIVLKNCSGWDNYRNDFAAVQCEYVEVDGGIWGDDSFVINKNASIDFEPDVNKRIGKAVAKNLKTYHHISFAADAGEALSGYVDNVEFDGGIYGTACGLAVGNFNVMHVGTYRHHSNARLFLMNAASYSDGRAYGGRFISDSVNQAQAPNLIPYTCAKTAGWDEYFVSGSATKTEGVLIGSHRIAFRLENFSAGYNWLRKNITAVTVNQYYSFGCLIRGDLFENNYHGIWVRCNGASEGNPDAKYYNRPTRIENTEMICGCLRIPTGTTSVDLFIGSDANTDRYDINFSEVYFCEGIVDNESVKSFGSPIVEAVPITAGGGLDVTGGSAVDGRIFRDPDYGLCMQVYTGTVTDFAIFGPSGGYALIRNPTGTQSLEFLGSGTNKFRGDVILDVAGNGFKIKEGSNATAGIATLVAGVAVVSTTKVTANSRIFLTRQTVAGTPGTSVDVTARTAGTSFTITAAGSILDTSTVAWWILEPAP